MKYLKTFEKSIFDAVEHNDIELVKKFIKNGTDLNIQDEFGYTALITSSS